MEEGTDGSVVIEIFDRAQLVIEWNLLEGVLLGMIEATLILTGKLSNLTDAFMVSDLRFIVQDPQNVNEWLDVPNGNEILASVEGQEDNMAMEQMVAKILPFFISEIIVVLKVSSTLNISRGLLRLG